MIKIFEILKKQIWGTPIWFIILVVGAWQFYDNTKPKSSTPVRSTKSRCTTCHLEYSGMGYSTFEDCAQKALGTCCSYKCCSSDSR